MDSLIKIQVLKLVKHIAGVSLFGGIFLVGCDSKKNLVDLECESAASIAQVLRFLEVEKPDAAVTNLYEVYTNAGLLGGWHSAHPSWYHREFKKHGKNAGFNNSYFEKYVVAPAFLTNLGVPGMPVFMSAQAASFGWGDKRRVIISRIGPRDYLDTWETEYRIQKVFKASGAIIPQPQAMPLPPKPPAEPKPQIDLITSVRIKSWRLANALGIPQDVAFLALLASVGLTFLLLGVAIYGLYLWLTRFHQQ
jgi:hypothetical protein